MSAMSTTNTHFEYALVDTLPRLAWCARVRKNEPTVTVVHGPWVEAREQFFCEGAWNGAFDAGGFADATALLGSGGALTPDGVLFATPTHMLERLHLLRAGDELFVSNSLAFVLAQANDSYDPDYKFYRFDILTLLRGLDRYKQQIPTRDGHSVELFYHSNFLVRPDLEVERLPKRLPARFTTYDEYIAYNRESIGAIARNATAASRGVRYEPLGTISSGYDSPFCALLAKEVGCREAITFTAARPIFGGGDDSGREIADLIGMHITEFDRQGYLTLDNYPEAEFVASGTGGEEVVFAPLQDILPGKIFFTGYVGDGAWSRPPGKITRYLRMTYPGGTSMGEFRLRVGFIHLPVPVLGYIHRPELFQIANAPEMAPWSVGGDYDRPIPRRFVEEHGVPRHLFGKKKQAVTQHVDIQDLEPVMCPASFRDLQQFASRATLFRSARGRVGFGVMRALYEANLRVIWRLQPLAKRLGVKLSDTPLVPARYSRPLGIDALTFHWGIERLLPRYRVPQDRGATTRAA